jgi:hypothetical protein
MIIVTVASKNVLPELHLLIQSIKLFIGPEQKVLVWGDDTVCRSLNYPNVSCHLGIDQFDLKKVGGHKAGVMKLGLGRSKSVLYCDSDVFFLSDHSFTEIDGLWLSPHHIRQEVAAGYGFYNSGYIGCGDHTFPDWWDAQPKECPGSYGDQQCLERAYFRSGHWPEQHNVGWWRKSIAISPAHYNLSVDGGVIIYNGLPLISTHTHILKLPGFRAQNTEESCCLNRDLLDCLRRSSNLKHKQLLSSLREVYI